VSGPLTDTERAVLHLEKHRWRNEGTKEAAIRDELGISATRFYQLLNVVIDSLAALAAEPVLVNRVRRLRDARRRRAG